MIFKISALFGLCILSSLVSAAVTIVVPEEIALLEINNQPINSGFLRNKKNYQVDAGDVNLNVRYQQYFDHGNNQHDILKSGILSLATKDLQDQQTYSLKLINPPQDFEQAKKYVDHPIVALLDQNKNIVAQQDVLSVASKSGLSQIFNLNNDRNNTEKKLSVQKANSNVSTIEDRSNIKTDDKVDPKSVASDKQLIEIWKKASKQERQKFMNWLTNHE